MNAEVAIQDLRDQVAALRRKVERLEGSTLLLHTTQVQPIDAVSDAASAAEVRASVQQITRALRTFGFGG